ncbi:ATP-binding protein [Candidatus Woesearchaeota archaeon]|nr:ATP-binding protein [Candidatus Woesearchaeota archaeon]
MNINIQNAEINYFKEFTEFAISNILSNAIKFTTPNSNNKINVYLKSEKDYAELTIQDTGEGMYEEDIQKIYEMKKESTLGTNGEKGTGLGLKDLIKTFNKSNINYELKSKPNEGTTWKIQFPLYKTQI